MRNNPWNDIEVPASDLHARRVDPEHVEDFFWARDHGGDYLFIFRSRKEQKMPEKFPALSGIEVETGLEPGGTRQRLMLHLNERKDWELFLTLCHDLVSSTRAAGVGADAVPSILLRRLTRWQEFLKRRRSGLLPEQKIKGLIGELLFLSTHLADYMGIGHAVKCWEGANDSPQDFCIGDTAVEVKCQLGTTAPKVGISSEQQLCSQLQNLFLIVFTLGKADGGSQSLNLLDLSSDIRDRLSNEAPELVEKFNNLLFETGYSDDEKYREYCYLLVDQRMYEVQEGFPRLCPDQLPLGVGHVRYEIDLNVCEPFASSPEWMVHDG